MRRLFRRSGGPLKRLGPPGSTGLSGRFSGGGLDVPLIATPETCLDQNIILRQERGEISSTTLLDEPIARGTEFYSPMMKQKPRRLFLLRLTEGLKMVLPA
jgi:hypothetical protein